MIRKPLDGIRVLELGCSALSAACGLILSDFGAEVIKIEASSQTRPTRSAYAAQNRGKKNMNLDPNQPEQLLLFKDLVKHSDALITDELRWLQHPGLSYESLKQENPRLVYTLISGYGATGPCADRPAADQSIQAESGIMSITGEENSAPVLCGAPIADYLGAMMGCIGTLMAVTAAQKSGKGRFVDVSSMDTLLFGLENQFSMYLKTGSIPGPIGNNYHLSAPVGVFPCKDGALTISVATHTQWIAFAEALNHTEWLEDPRFATVQDRIRNYLVLNEEVKDVFTGYTYNELIKTLQSRHCIYGQVNNFADVTAHPQVVYRQSFVSAAYADGDTYTVPAVPVRMNDMNHETYYLVPSTVD